MAAQDNGAAASGELREAERVARQRKRSIAIALSLGFLVVLFYVATLVKWGATGGQAPQPERAGQAGSVKQ